MNADAPAPGPAATGDPLGPLDPRDPLERHAPRDPLEPAIAEVEQRLAALALALREPEGRGVDTAAVELQRALALALDRFKQSRTPLSPALRQRLARASAQVAAHRDTFARATAALDRAIDVLLPRDAPVYNARGTAAHAAHSGVLKA